MSEITEWLRDLSHRRSTAFGSDGLDGCRYEEAANEITRLRCELENADMAGYKRGFNDARDLARAGDHDVVPELVDKSRQIAELQEQLHHLFGIEQSRDKAEATLAEAREVIERIEKESIDVSRAEARAFLERTK